MANIKFLISAALAAFFSTSVHAGYAQLQPPSGFSTGAGSQVTYTKAANNAPFNMNTVRTNATLNIGGQTITVPAGARVAANAATLLAPLLFRNPWLRTAAAIGSYFWLNGAWHEMVEGAPRTALVYKTDWGRIVMWFDSPEYACDADRAMAVSVQPEYNYSASEVYSNGGSPWCRYYIFTKTGGFVARSDRPILEESRTVKDQTPVALSEPRFNSEVIPKVTPNDIAQVVPEGVPIPVTPVVNPSPGDDPSPQTFRSPVGEPQALPNTDPVLYRQPVVDIVPAPQLDSPWRVDVQPNEITTNDPQSLDFSNPQNQQQSSNPTSQELCEKYPDIIACQKLNFDTPDMDKISTKDVEINLEPDSGWLSGSGSCPAPRHLSGANVDFDFQTFCNFMSGVRPVVIAIAWLSAAMILIGFKRGE